MSKRNVVAAATALAVLLIVGFCVFQVVFRAESPASIDAASKLYLSMDLKGTERVLQRILAAPEGAPESKAEALIAQARIAWKFYKEPQRARELLGRAAELKVKEYEVQTVLSRVERQSGRFEQALASAARAIDLANSRRRWVEARSLWAQAVWEQSRARIEKDQPFDARLVEQSVTVLKEVLQEVAGYPGPSRVLLALALLAKDGEAAWLAWKSYFNISEDDPPEGVLEGPYDLLRDVLPRWRRGRPSRAEGLTLIRGLGDSRFYEYGGLVRQLFFKNDPFDDAPDVRDMLLYADAIDAFGETADEYYRMLALGQKDEVAFENALLEEAERLWLALSFEDERPAFSFGSFCAEMKSRFGAHIILGGTGNYRGKVLIMGHLIDRQSRTVEQYGFQSEFSHLRYDMMMSNGYSSWFWDGRAAIGGWATADEMASIGAGSTGKFYKMWWRVTDDAEREKTERYMADRLEDEERAVRKSIAAPLYGLSCRMQFKASEAMVDELKGSGLEAEALALAFVRRYARFQVGKNIFAHEGRHSIDQKFFADDWNHWKGSEKEFRAKLSEVVFSSDPYLALADLLAQSVNRSEHGKANLKIRKVLVKWMKAHRDEIRGIDAGQPLLVQAHLLTADQIRQCFTDADPLARRSR
ncbi:MAG: hypothetical protein JSW27_15815 [Phycisphaerales bacterium]|nr:MAG: hypothetical protein JSW27_15815 [Phycisphaerales bacterium]